ncbi:putative Peptidyl tRNA hydrolase PTH2 [Trypanosoma vivax]|uniref:peptidyl-tRNA hydrolase n=1 Tax=Trypanosoma vivax (strain Y486) TaxID=1055687 RepID=G0TX38_TRYVY|nr:hypothetical protein TRVL_02703 [Trypanosoma vivax]KAH8614183.1 putative Peptidyl tRNA hydrolase PTH2 [Trypanosoma vivax]CCC48528.1 conserved hypothetical protein [Trypanosoma vivax Y486]
MERVIRLCLAGFVLGLIAPIVIVLLGKHLEAIMENGPSIFLNQRASFASKRQRGGRKQESISQQPGCRDNVISGDIVEENGDSADSGGSNDKHEDYFDDAYDDSDYELIEKIRLKMVLVIRGDLKRVAPQVVTTLAAGAAVDLVQLIEVSEAAHPHWKEWHFLWCRGGCTKIALKGIGLEAIQQIRSAARCRGLACCSRSINIPTPVGSSSASGSENMEKMVVLAIGPAPSSKIDPITDKLKLFS